MFALQASAEEVVVKALKYSACVDVIDSDHKPVWALLALDVPVTNQEKKRRMCSHILKQTAAQGRGPDCPALQASCDTVQLNQVHVICWTARLSVLDAQFPLRSSTRVAHLLYLGFRYTSPGHQSVAGG